ncbi:MAG: arginase family protein [Nocardioidaceae bacterium]|nr:arginase family protein [Nocardioidaceae bacterium]
MVRLICVPYHLGREGVGMGAGPDRMLAAGAEALVRGQGHSVVVDRVALPGRFKHEIGAYFALQDAVARHVRRAVRQGDFPFVLGGNCGCVLGSAAGIGLGEHGGVIWFDAHGDMNTPETSASGFLDGMSMAVLTGQCWATLATSIPGLTALPADRVLLAGARALDDGERDLIRSTRMPFIAPDGLGGEGSEFTAAVRHFAERADGVHVHIDLDVIDLGDGRANEFAAAGGPPLDTLVTAVRGIGDQTPVKSVSLTSYHPSCDDDGRALTAGLRLLESLAGLAVTR